MEPAQELPEKFAPMGLTYDDVLLLPGYSEIARRLGMARSTVREETLEVGQ